MKNFSFTKLIMGVMLALNIAVVVGFAVAYAAMFGFDKLREALEKIQKVK